jgi:hypothetical protein
VNEVIIGAGLTFAERLACVRVEAGIALWAIPFGADWEAAWRACPRADWLLEMYMLGLPVVHGSEEHKKVLRLLFEEICVRLMVHDSGRAEERLLLSIVDAWLKDEFGARMVQATLDNLRSNLKQLRELSRFDPEAHVSVAVYLLAEGVSDPVAPSLCARALAYASPSSLLVDRLAAALPCPSRLRVTSVLLS